ncbi:TetR/AcrR family transcriptional regulator [Streptomyces sp.]|uniref:TetR/AcrR family transcriptional regulator n=1 Tax=Streptomyces sp. TaxID=1931 RepID=UPI002D76D634|nr:TetR/AcrR family transcriptional regulator [Streptomyces sp.]HET6358907.1 TetR/AcrR family transcriptional regulator [Streptomyces sp.]
MSPTPGHRRPPTLSNPRVQRTRAHILAIARELLPGVGSAGLTYALLAERAKVTRQTLYRHWPTRANLLSDLMLEGPDVAYPEPSTDVRTVATAWLTSLRAGLSDPPTRAASLAVIAQADLDSTQALTRIVEDRQAAFNTLLEPSGRQITADEYTLLTAPVIFRLLIEGREVTDQFIDAVAAQWLNSLDQPDQPQTEESTTD